MTTTRIPAFHGARWAFWLALVTPSALMVGNVCSERDTAYLFLFTVVVVLICLWEAHVRCLLDQTQRGWRMVPRMLLRFVGTFWRLMAWMLLASLPVLLLIPSYACYTGRAQMMRILAATGVPLKVEISERVKSSKTLEHAGRGLSVESSGRLAGGMVTETGTIFLVSETPPAVVSLTPQLKDGTTGELTWTCLGYPARTMPSQCRASASNAE